MRRTAIAIAVLFAVAGCGRRETLQPAEGVALPPKPAEARVQPTVDELLTPTQTARPGRSEEILRKSQIRQDDRFDLPPRG